MLAEMDTSVYTSEAPGFAEFKGALAENYILQSLVAQYEKTLRYWTSGNTAEIDFILNIGNEIIPIEVKADTNTVGKSLIEYQKKYNPRIRIRYSMKNLNLNGNLLNIPLFMSDKTRTLLNIILNTPTA
jgi:predicted AAA+ superfamily ATPase